ncbi:MAG: lipoprotein-releasing ABC transporter ATP-binding protein LolD [Proteobacteria bacterium]|nr:lipoprotein-releasing ABC transporter ATP-binding protein LolD [Pseudomonadota bacterium]
MNNPVIFCQNLKKTFQDGIREVNVLKNVNLSVAPGERIAILGTSGSGKSTLLQLLGGLDKPTAGAVFVGGENLIDLSEAERCYLRNHQLGFIYQFHHLLPEFTALENVAMPLLVRGAKPKYACAEALELLSAVGLRERVTHKIGELSGGERQRVAIARALVTKPACVLADEPTGNLDANTAEKVYECMLELNQALHTSFIIVTHDISLANKMNRVVKLVNGELHAA